MELYHRRPFAASTLALALLAGCSSSPAAPAAPTGLSLGPGSSFEEIVLLWTPPSSPVTGYEGELRLEGGAWEMLPGQVSGDSIGATVSLNAQVPELSTLEAHVRARNGSAASPWSAPASWFRGLRPFTSASAAVEGQEHVRVQWVQGSAAAPDVRIERALYDDLTFTYGDYQVSATLPPTAGDWLDADVALVGRGVRYRLRGVATYRGAPVEGPAVEVAPATRPEVRAPVNLQATLSGGAPRLTWTNVSGAANTVRLERADGLVDGTALFSPVVSLPADASSWTDPVPAGAYTYRVLALANLLPAASAPAQVVVPPAGFDLTVLEAPAAGYAARGGDGGLWLAAAGFGKVSLWEPSGATWTRHGFTPLGDRIAAPGPVLDAAGHPHLVYLEDLPNGTTSYPSDLIHAWHDGAAWQQEVIARRTVDSDGNGQVQVFLALDTGGTPHVAWKNWERTFPEHATRTAAGWTVESLTSSLHDPNLAFSLESFGAAPDGTLSLLVAGPGTLVLWTRPPGGAWAEALVPATGNVGVFYGGQLLPFPGGVTVAYRRFAQADPLPYKLTVLTRTGATWGAAVEVAGFDTPGSSGLPLVGVADGARAALLVPQGLPEGLWLYRWEAAAGWSGARLQQSTGFSANWLGFLPGGRLWLVTSTGAPVTLEEATLGVTRRYLSLTER